LCWLIQYHEWYSQMYCRCFPLKGVQISRRPTGSSSVYLICDWWFNISCIRLYEYLRCLFNTVYFRLIIQAYNCLYKALKYSLCSYFRSCLQIWFKRLSLLIYQTMTRINVGEGVFANISSKVDIKSSMFIMLLKVRCAKEHSFWHHLHLFNPFLEFFTFQG